MKPILERGGDIPDCRLFADVDQPQKMPKGEQLVFDDRHRPAANRRLHPHPVDVFWRGLLFAEQSNPSQVVLGDCGRGAHATHVRARSSVGPERPVDSLGQFDECDATALIICALDVIS